MGKVSVRKIVYNFLSFFNMKAKAKHSYRIKCFYDGFINALIGMFAYTIDKIANPFFNEIIMEKLLITEGECGVAKTENDGLVVGRFSFDGGDLDYNGFLTRGKVITLNGKEFTGEVGKDIIWIWNDYNRSCDENLSRFATILADVDLSLDYNIKYSRNCPIPLVKNSKLKQSIKKVFESIFEEGKMEIVLDDTQTLSEMMGKESNKIEMLNLSDVSTSDKIQNLTMLSDWLMSRICRYYGISLTGNGKKAQQSVEEISGYSQFSAVNPLSRLAMRRKACEEITRNLGVEISVDFSIPWKMLEESVEVESDTDIDKDGKKGVNEDEIKED